MGYRKLHLLALSLLTIAFSSLGNASNSFIYDFLSATSDINNATITKVINVTREDNPVTGHSALKLTVVHDLTVGGPRVIYLIYPNVTMSSDAFTKLESSGPNYIFINSADASATKSVAENGSYILYLKGTTVTIGREGKVVHFSRGLASGPRTSCSSAISPYSGRILQ